MTQTSGVRRGEVLEARPRGQRGEPSGKKRETLRSAQVPVKAKRGGEEGDLRLGSLSSALQLFKAGHAENSHSSGSARVRGEHMFITGPSIIEWSLVSPAPEAAASSQWERPRCSPPSPRPRLREERRRGGEGGLWTSPSPELALVLVCSCLLEERGGRKEGPLSGLALAQHCQPGISCAQGQ